MPSKPWQTKAWREKRKLFLEGKSCEWCGASERLVIHHLTYLNPDGSSISSEQYLDWENNEVVVLCRKCHTNYHKGKVKCKVCGEHWHDPKYKFCWNCYIETPQGQATVDRIVEEQYENQIIEEKNPICGKSFEIARWRLEIHGDIPSICIIHCGEAHSCELFQRWEKGELPDEETADPEHFKRQREFEDRLYALVEQGMDEEEAAELLFKEYKAEDST